MPGARITPRIDTASPAKRAAARMAREIAAELTRRASAHDGTTAEGETAIRAEVRAVCVAHRYAHLREVPWALDREHAGRPALDRVGITRQITDLVLRGAIRRALAIPGGPPPKIVREFYASVEA